MAFGDAWRGNRDGIDLGGSGGAPLVELRVDAENLRSSTSRGNAETWKGPARRRRPAARLMVSLWTVHPVASTVWPRAPAIACNGMVPAAGQAIHGLPALPVPPKVHMHDERSVPPTPMGPSEFDRIQRR